MVKFKDFSRLFSVFQGKFYFQGLFKTVLYIQVLFKPVGTLLLHAGGSDFRLYDGSDLKTLLLMRW